MKCPVCKTVMGKTNGSHQYRECGLDNVWLENWPMYMCPEGHAQMPVLPDAREIATVIARELVKQEGSLDADSVLFLRKLLRVKSSELAHILRVHRVAVSRWENGREPISFEPDFKLRLEVIDRVIPVDEQRALREEVAIIFQRARKPEPTSNPIRVPGVALACV